MAPPAVALLQVRSLDFAYGPLQVLFGIDLDVHEGEVVALLGANGAGKSTLLRAVSGLAPLSGGTVHLAGEDITTTSAVARVTRGLVQVPGGRAMFPDLSVEENLRIGGFTLRRQPGLLAERREAVLDLFPTLRVRSRQKAGSLSGGERQMLALAKGLLLEPKVLCIDELSLGLAPVVVEQLLIALRLLRERGITLVVVEQSVNLALGLADRAVFIEKGHVAFEGRATDLLERDDLVAAVLLGGVR